MAAGVTCSSPAARAKLRWRAAASKLRSALSGGSRRLTGRVTSGVDGAALSGVASLTSASAERVSLRKGCIEILHDVLDVLEADRQAQQIVEDAELGPGLGRQALMGGGGWV